MKKILMVTAAAAIALFTMTASVSANGVLGDVGRAAGDVVNGVANGANEILDPAANNVPGGSSGAITDVAETTANTTATTTKPNNATNNEATGVAAVEFVGLSIAAVGGMTAMAMSARKKR